MADVWSSGDLAGAADSGQMLADGLSDVETPLTTFDLPRAVAGQRKLEHRCDHEEQTRSQPNVDRLDVGHAWESRD